MSLTVRHLNGDSTFLLIFSPKTQPASSDLLSANGAYSILIDPWITGTSSIVNAKWFAITDRVEPSSVSHLSELEEPDVVVCSQNKPDHTHKETLLQLRPEGKTIIAAEPGAAKVIKSWNYFDPNRVHSLVRYDPKATFGNSLRLHIPPLSVEGSSGEVVISFIPAKNYVTGLHNAIGITYQAPTKIKSPAPVTTVDLPKTKYFHLPLTPKSSFSTPSQPVSPVSITFHMQATDSQETVVPAKSSGHRAASHRPRLSRSTNTASSELLSFPDQPPIRPSMDDTRSRTTSAKQKPNLQLQNDTDRKETVNAKQGPPTPPESPNYLAQPPENHTLVPQAHIPNSSIPNLPLNNRSHSSIYSHSRVLSTSNKIPTIYPARPKALSVLYTPHGISISDLQPYVQNHLVKTPGALPLTLLLHSFEYAQNPWYFGGNIMTGAAGGIAIAKALMARCWISAHDEPKIKGGISVKMLKTRFMNEMDIRRELVAGDEQCRKFGWICDVRTLGVGREMRLSSEERHLLAGSAYGFDVEESEKPPNQVIVTQRTSITSIG